MIKKISSFFTRTVLFTFLIFYNNTAQAGFWSSIAEFLGLSPKTQEAQISTVNMDAVANITSNLNTYKNTADLDMAIAAGTIFLNSENAEADGFESLKQGTQEKMKEMTSSKESQDKFQGNEVYTTMINFDQKTIMLLVAKKEMQLAAMNSFKCSEAIAIKAKEIEVEATIACTKTIEATYKNCEPTKSLTGELDKMLDDLLSIREGAMPSKIILKDLKDQNNKFTKKLESLENKLNESAQDFENQAMVFTDEEDFPSAEEARENKNLCLASIKPLTDCKKLIQLNSEYESYGKMDFGFDAGAEGGGIDNETPLAATLGHDPKLEALFSTVSESLGTDFDSLIFTPYKRIILWQMSADLAERTANATQDVIDAKKDNLIKVKDIISKLKEADSGNAASGVAGIAELHEEFVNKLKLGKNGIGVAGIAEIHDEFVNKLKTGENGTGVTGIAEIHEEKFTANGVGAFAEQPTHIIKPKETVPEFTANGVAGVADTHEEFTVKAAPTIDAPPAKAAPIPHVPKEGDRDDRSRPQKEVQVTEAKPVVPEPTAAQIGPTDKESVNAECALIEQAGFRCMSSSSGSAAPVAAAAPVVTETQTDAQKLEALLKTRPAPNADYIDQIKWRNKFCVLDPETCEREKRQNRRGIGL